MGAACKKGGIGPAPGRAEWPGSPDIPALGKADGVFLCPGLKGSGLFSRYLFDGIFHYRLAAVTNQLEGLGDCLGHGSRKPGAEETLKGRLVRLLPEWEPEPVELHALYPSQLNSSPKVRVFLQFLRERFGAEPLLNGH
jgi:DNA-binding transcriptional LysR family regulator